MKQTSVRIVLAMADDNVRFRNGFINIINLAYPGQFDFQVIADNGRDLIEKLHTVKELPEIILLDINMPVMNGYQTMTIIREQWPEQKVICFSLFNDDYAIIKMITHGVNGYVVKDMSPHDICFAIKTISNGGRYFADVPEKFLSLSIEELQQLAPNLTEKEMKFLELCATEMKYDEMAEILGISIRTVHSYRDILFKKFDISTRAGLVLFATRIGLAPVMNANQSSYFK